MKIYEITETHLLIVASCCVHRNQIKEKSKDKDNYAPHLPPFSLIP